MSDDPRVDRLAPLLTFAATEEAQQEAAEEMIATVEQAGLAVVIKNNWPSPNLVWDIGDPEPPEDVTEVFDYSEEMWDQFDADHFRWGRTATGWKGYKNGDGVYLDWAELVRRWGPVRRGFGPAAQCQRCLGVANHSTPECCSSHRKVLCHSCYKRTHFVEVCDCSICKTETAHETNDG